VSRSPAQRGLTLVELLVTLVLVALATSLVIGGIGQASALLGRVSADQGNVYQELMARTWLRQSIAAVVPQVGDQRNLVGGPGELRIQSFRPLLGAEGMATEIAWRIGTQGTLEYVEGDQAMQIGALPPALRFEYQDAGLAWHEEWPVDEESGLPERIGIVFADADDRLLVTPFAQKAPAVDPDEESADSE
jgi:general secretion pathway protein J